MPGMPSARGIEHKHRAGDGSHERYQKGMEVLFPVLKCVVCIHEKKNHCTHVVAPEDNAIVSVVGNPPEWCPAKGKNGKNK